MHLFLLSLLTTPLRNSIGAGSACFPNFQPCIPDGPMSCCDDFFSCAQPYHEGEYICYPKYTKSVLGSGGPCLPDFQPCNPKRSFPCCNSDASCIQAGSDGRHICYPMLQGNKHHLGAGHAGCYATGERCIPDDLLCCDQNASCEPVGSGGTFICALSNNEIHSTKHRLSSGHARPECLPNLSYCVPDQSECCYGSCEWIGPCDYHVCNPPQCYTVGGECNVAGSVECCDGASCQPVGPDGKFVCIYPTDAMYHVKVAEAVLH